MVDAVVIRAAVSADVPGIAECVRAAYTHYTERIGKPPRPMFDDYAEVLGRAQVHVAQDDGGAIVGVLVLQVTDQGFYLENVAVHPTRQGSGLGRRLLELAEAEALRAGYDQIYLATHEKMTENRALYARIGYVEYDRREVNGYQRVFFRKSLAG